MTLPPLIIDEKARQAIRKLILHAERHIFTMLDLVDIKKGNTACAGDRKGFTCHLNIGYTVVYSLEQQKKLVRHISISVEEEHRLPGLETVGIIIGLFGFTRPLEECLVRLEHTYKTHKAINVWEEID